MPILLAFAQLAAIAQSLFPLFAQIHTAQNPEASNAALTNASNAISAAQVIVAAGEQAAQAAVAAGATAPTGLQKLDMARAVVQQAHAIVVSNGGTTATWDAYWNPINAAITTICAASKPVLPSDLPFVG